MYIVLLVKICNYFYNDCECCDIWDNCKLLNNNIIFEYFNEFYTMID